MARIEREREDLMREATAFERRGEVQLPGGRVLFVGVRPNGAVSFYFGADPVFQFNEAGQLRRAFSGDRLQKAEHGRVVSLRRHRGGETVDLLRHEYTDDEQATFLAFVESELLAARRALASEGDVVLRRIPAAWDLRGEIADWLRRHERVVVAQRPSQ
ncbi:MAG: hypothetical protein QGG36_15170 [Pirellulaceae bacterium]|jgi:hypothetical protein|nr:hypothetical protein [Pirellulaceae bacterium]